MTINVAPQPLEGTTAPNTQNAPYPPFTPPAAVPTLRQLHEEKMAVTRELAESKDAVEVGAAGSAFMRSPYWTAILVFAIVFFLLYAVQPPIVRDGDKVVLRKVAGWSVLAGGAVIAIPWVCRLSGIRLPWMSR